MGKIITCALCNKHFEQTKHFQKYCSYLCKYTADRIQRAVTEETKVRLRSSVREHKESKLDKMDPDDLLHYGRWQTRQILKGEGK